MLGAFTSAGSENSLRPTPPTRSSPTPQSGERIAGRDNIRAVVEAFPSPPHFTINDVHSAGDLVVVEADADYGEGPPWKAALVYKLTDGKVASESGYFGVPFEAAEWRAPFRQA